MIQVIICYDKSLEEFKLYNKEMDIMITSPELFKLLVLFNSSLVERFGEDINILKSDEIEYILDSASMKRMIMSNVKLIKRLSKGPSAFQAAGERFGVTNTTQPTQFQSKSSGIGDFDDMMSKPKGKKFSKKFK